MLKCNRCGLLFDAGYATNACPECHSDSVDELLPCSMCGEYHSELINGICKDCFKNSANCETAIGYGNTYLEPIELNGFLVHFFGKDRIEEILTKALDDEPNKKVEEEARRYCMDDQFQFSDYLAQMEFEKDYVFENKRWKRRK